jgi:alpha/beta superfamily hydrolase
MIDRGNRFTVIAKQHAFFLAVQGRPLSATLFVPPTLRGAVLFVPPFAEERKGALPVFVQAARFLAGHGIASLLFDFTGTGDSGGDFTDTPPDCFDAEAEAALDWLGRTFPSVKQAVLGLRTGASLASRLAARRPELTALVLWSPVSGPDFMRQLLQRRMVNDMVAYGQARESRAALEARLRAGDPVDLDGFLFSGAFYQWALQLEPRPAAIPVFLATGGHDEKGLAAFPEGAANVTRSELRHPPFWNTVGHVDLTNLIHATTAWLAAHVAETSPAALPELSLNTVAPRSELIDLNKPFTARACLDRPAGEPRGGLLFLHGWSGDRTGPHRLFVLAARQFAESGWLCLRPDFNGRGLSDGDGDDASIARMTENAQQALLALRQRLPPGAPVAVVAICSGCKVAIALAADTPNIDRLALWSAESMGSLRSSATGLRKTWSALVTYGTKLLRPETWKKLLSGKVQTGMVAKALVKHETRTPQEAAWEDGVLKRFRAFRSPILFVFGGSDPDAPGSSRAYESFCRRNGIPHSTHTVAHAGHSYYGDAWARELLDVSARFLNP